MLDTKVGKYLQPILEKSANICIKYKISANAATVFALLIGILAAVFVAFEYIYVGIALLWFSGFMDSVDGCIARKLGSSSPIGTLLDIVFDRIVEILMLWAIVIIDPDKILAIAFVLSTIIISMTIFLTVGATAPKIGKKSFYYQPGLAERSEGFIFLTFAACIAQYRFWILIAFGAIILFTAAQRLKEAIKILKE